MEATIPIVKFTKRLLLGITIAFSLCFAMLLIYMLFANFVEGSDLLSGRSEILIIIFCFIAILQLLTFFFWIKETQYIGTIGVALIYFSLWAYTPGFTILFTMIKNLLLNITY